MGSPIKSAKAGIALDTRPRPTAYREVGQWTCPLKKVAQGADSCPLTDRREDTPIYSRQESARGDPLSPLFAV